MNNSNIDSTVIDDVQERIENGIVFEVSSKQSVANAGGKAKWLFVTGSKRVVVYSRVVTTNGDEMEYQAFKAPTVSANGTPLTIGKRNGNSPINSTVKVYEAPTTTADGQGIPPVYMPGASGQGQAVIGQFNQEGFVRILEPNTVYMVHVINQGKVNPANIEWYLMWAELTLPA